MTARPRSRSIRSAPAIAAVAIGVVALLLLGSGPLARADSPPSASRPAPLPGFNITFAANSTAEVEDLIADRAYIGPGDSFDLASGNPPRADPLNVSAVNEWAAMLHAAYPSARITAHTAGLPNYATLAAAVGPNISGLYYDYESGYDPEFTTNFSRTLENFENATKIAHAHGLESIGYPTGKALADPTTYPGWNYASIGAEADQVVIQSQRYCERSTASYAGNVSVALAQFAAAPSEPKPIFQITIGPRTGGTGYGVRPTPAYDCAHVLAEDGLHDLYLWWNPVANADVLTFLKDIGRHPAG